MINIKVKLSSRGNFFWLAKWRDAQGPHCRRLGKKAHVPLAEAIAQCARLEIELRKSPPAAGSPRQPDHPIVHLHSNAAYWQLVWTDETGMHRNSIGAKSKISEAQALEVCRNLEYELAKSSPAAFTPAGAMKLSEWIKRYASQRTDLAKGTREIDNYCAEYLLRHFDHDPLIYEITRADAAEWRSALASGELHLMNARHVEAPHDQTVCKHSRAARAMFNEALKQGLVALNPFAGLRGTPRRLNKQWAYIDRQQMQSILDACRNDRWRCLFALCRFAGLRRGEALALTWRQVDWAGNKIMVGGDRERIDTKHRPRVVPIEPARCPSGLTAILRQAFESAPEGATLVCPLGWQSVNGQAVQIIERAGLVRYAKSFHALRRCCEMDWAGQYPQHVVSEWLGHSIEVSARHYLRVPSELYSAPPAPMPAVGGQPVAAETRVGS